MNGYKHLPPGKRSPRTAFPLSGCDVEAALLSQVGTSSYHLVAIVLLRFDKVKFYDKDCKADDGLEQEVVVFC